ncbi:DUF563 domain-containing protein [Phycicoccus sp. DTK01]|uniref:glycosyltransferase family 61 protein n=1 Tax=Phycicoccus sp. DTK01 TaxID=2785745 RepID=UPI001A8C126D|nr:glycosyltransferase 61 family protein [Phycicoccus sp. DTK01]GIL34741.1 hypothetical protein PDTK01_08170 [Phycicoccus sp. DTK01]
MTSTTSAGPFFFVDLEGDRLVVVPALAGASGPTKVVVRGQDPPTADASHVVPAGGHLRLDLGDVWPLPSFSVRLEQERDDGTWVELRPYTSLRGAGDFDRDVITPGTWGVHESCVAVLREPATRKVVLRRAVAAGGSTPFTYPAAHDAELVLEFNRRTDEGVGLGPRVGPTLRWSPVALRGAPTRDVSEHAGGLRAAQREDVTLAPRALVRAGEGPLRTEGFVGAWSGDEPVVEAVDFVLGRQEMLFQPSVPEPEVRPGTVVYLGRPHSSWGHFLTQGLARVWYAQRHPELPVVWDSPGRLRPYQQQVLDLVGVQNDQILLTEPARWERVVFPFPGVCIGDYVTPGFVESIGVVPPAPPVPGKRLFLTRTGVAGFPEGAEREADRIMEEHGFTVFHPQRHPIEEQLSEISSAETVVAFEGSSLHTPLLLRDPLHTRFWALTRHRRGAGLFEHIRQAKGLRYETLNFLRSPIRRAREPVDLDLVGLERALTDTDGFTTNLEALEAHREHPAFEPTSYDAHRRMTQVRAGRPQTALTELRLAVLAGDVEHARRLARS